MAAIGCLAPFVLAALGALIGNSLYGPMGALWVALGGFVVGGLVAGVTLRAFMAYKKND